MSDVVFCFDEERSWIGPLLPFRARSTLGWEAENALVIVRRLFGIANTDEPTLFSLPLDQLWALSLSKRFAPVNFR
jgi:hypothetical protein